MSDLNALTALAERLRAVDAVGVQIAEAAIPDVLAEARKTAAAGTSPDGKAWAKTKDGRDALPKAASSISAHVSGSTKAVITLVLPYPYNFAQHSKGKRHRPVLFDPEDGVPAAMQAAIERSAREVIAKTMGGA